MQSLQQAGAAKQYIINNKIRSARHTKYTRLRNWNIVVYAWSKSGHFGDPRTNRRTDGTTQNHMSRQKAVPPPAGSNEHRLCCLSVVKKF